MAYPLDRFREMETSPFDRAELEEVKCRYYEMQEELGRAQQQQTADKQAQDRYNRWHEAIEQLAKVEQLLAELEGWEANEPDTKVGKAFNWTERLDKVLAELSHYRQELMKRVAQVAMKRLVQPTDGAHGGG